MVSPASVPASLFRAVLEQSAVPTALVGADGRIDWCNSEFGCLSADRGLRPGQNLFHSWPIPEPDVAETLRSAFAEGRPTTVRSVAPRAHDQAGRRVVDLLVRPLARARPTRSVVTVVDVTDWVSEHERAGLFYQAFRSSTNAIEVTDRSGILVDVNPAFESIYGYTRAECIGRKPNLVRSRRTSPEVYAQLWADLLDPTRGFWSGEIINRDRLGRERPVLLTITSVHDERGVTTHYLGVAVDLTEQKAWERAAARADKLASLGQLAAGVAHEINTPLANVLLVAESIRRKTSDDWVRARAETIREQVRVADRIVLGLLDFARRTEPRMVLVDLRDVTREAVTFVRGKQSHDMEVVERYPSSPVSIQGDRVQIIQVITNILNNAYDATPPSGRITVELRAEGPTATLEVTDTGAGIPVSVLPHLFEPFFTTKAEGHGTGLGLAICHGIVQAHHGTISASNAPDAGARFTLTFPLTDRLEAAHLAGDEHPTRESELKKSSGRGAANEPG